MINTISKNNVEEEKVYFMSVAPVCPEERLQQEQRAGTWRQNVEQRAWGTLSWLASPVCSPGPLPMDGTAHSGLNPHTN